MHLFRTNVFIFIYIYFYIVPYRQIGNQRFIKLGCFITSVTLFSLNKCFFQTQEGIVVLLSDLLEQGTIGLLFTKDHIHHQVYAAFIMHLYYQ